MNAQTLAKTAYASATGTVRSSRAVEYEVIARTTHELKQAAETKKTDFSRFAEALHKNNRLWSTLAANVADSQNALPPDLRAQIFYLAEFTQRHAAQTLAGQGSVAPLLEINTAILRGLRQGRGM